VRRQTKNARGKTFVREPPFFDQKCRIGIEISFLSNQRRFEHRFESRLFRRNQILRRRFQIELVQQIEQRSFRDRIQNRKNERDV
jgi:hypothetical protein